MSTGQPLRRVLYVEDEPDIREIATLALERMGGFEVHTCPSGKDALEAVHGFSPDLILLDVMMPGMDGPTTLQAFRELPELANTPIVFMTAKTQAHEVERYRALGVAGIIAKPFDPMTIADKVREFWSEHVGTS